jgi:hypothetical protein
MQTGLYRPSSRGAGLKIASISAMLLISLWISGAQAVLADAGGWPTATSTPTQVIIILPTLTPTPSIVPTSQLLTFPPTPTYTPVFPLLSGELAAPELQARADSSRASNSLGLSWLTCLPFGFVFAALGIAGYYYFRIRQPGAP